MKANPYDFWKWAYSDFLSNAHRGVLAEYIVDMATGVTHRPRVQWDDYDLETKSGLRVDVNSAAFLQSWAQERPNAIRFDIAQRSGRRLSRPASALRAADVYVFCLLSEKTREAADPLDVNQWIFFVCPTSAINEHFKNQKSISLQTVARIGLPEVRFDEMAQQVDAADLAQSIAILEHHRDQRA